MRHAFSILAVLTIALGSACHCAKNAGTAAGSPAPPATDAAAVAAVPVPPVPPAPAVNMEEQAADQGLRSVGDSVYFSMQRTPCFGTCPSYTLTILENGTATYVGGRFAAREGSYIGKVDAETMEKLWQMAETANFFSMNDKYDGNATDLPSTIVRMHGKGKDKRVIARQGTPQTFRNFAESAEALLSSVEWTLASDQDK